MKQTSYHHIISDYGSFVHPMEKVHCIIQIPSFHISKEQSCAGHYIYLRHLVEHVLCLIKHSIVYKTRHQSSSRFHILFRHC
uniref:Uncharacterized protein n=1 Tax=Arundo donax TaxID=35708 RepID=A0A0A9EGX3_ARUDO